jgi:hypothetical protein
MLTEIQFSIGALTGIIGARVRRAGPGPVFRSADASPKMLPTRSLDGRLQAPVDW